MFQAFKKNAFCDNKRNPLQKIMSLKILNAVRFNKNMSLSDVVSWLESVKPEVRDLVYKEDCFDILKRSVHNWDIGTLAQMGWSDALIDSTALSQAVRDVRKERAEDKIDHSVILFMRENTVYGFLNLQSLLPNWRKPYEGTVFEDYSYWNHTDRPDDISEETWDERQKVWKEILGNCWSVSEVGMSVLMSYTSSFDRSVTRFMRDQKSENKKNLEDILKEVSEATLSRSARLHPHVKHAPWNPEELARAEAHVLIKHMMDLDRGRNEIFNEAKNFLSSHVLDQTVSLDDLFKSPEEIDMSQKRSYIDSLDIPRCLKTPMFEKKMLERNIPDKKDNTPQIKKKI